MSSSNLVEKNVLGDVYRLTSDKWDDVYAMVYVKVSSWIDTQSTYKKSGDLKNKLYEKAEKLILEFL